MEVFNNINYNEEYVNNIKTSKYEQKINIQKEDIHETKIEEKKYDNIENLILSQYEYELLLETNYDNIKMKIASSLEDNKTENYTNYKYNSRKLNIRKIQEGLQEKNTLTTIIYLSDKYKINIYVYNKSNNNTYLVSTDKIKNKENIYLELNNNKFKKVETLNINNVITEIDEIKFINNNIKTKDIYIKYLNPITKYKLNDLIDIANNNNISIKINNKNKTKQQLYDDINNEME